MRFILSPSPLTSSLKRSQHQHYHLLTCRTLVDDATVNQWVPIPVRDRGLDHAVEREKNLKPILNLKNFIKAEPSKSLPISIIAEKRESLQIPIRPVEFIRRYPSVFEEFMPGGIGVHPHIRLRPEVLNLDAEEQLIYQSDTYRHQSAVRLLKLLMISRINEIPLSIIDRLKWDLGLPQDYVQTIVPEFPDYFRVVNGKHFSNERFLELVCYSSELATSVLEKKAARNVNGNGNGEQGVPTAFPLKFLRGFEMDKKLKKWLDGWQKLPYISPYENALHLPPKSDESDKWAAAVMHELLHIFVPKKTEKENLLCLGEYLGMRSRFKRALLNHPGIFYLSRKIGTYTVLLREGYKRGMLIENSPLMNMRSQYIHLMNIAKEDRKSDTAATGSAKKKKLIAHDSKGKREEDDDDESEDDHDEVYDSSSSELEDASDNYEDEDDDDEEDEDDSRAGAPNNVANSRGQAPRRNNLNRKGPVRERSARKHPGRTNDKVAQNVSRKAEVRSERNVNGSLSPRTSHLSSWGRSSPKKRTVT